ncbi:MAG: hypothetical protein QXK47_02315 [Candidatus Bathyarchaeia archaeon]
MDVLPPRNLRVENYPCTGCPYKSDKTCAKCIFAGWNVKGILGGLAPDQKTRLKFSSDVSASDLMMSLPNSPLARLMDSLHPKLSQLVVPSYNRISELLNMLKKR